MTYGSAVKSKVKVSNERTGVRIFLLASLSLSCSDKVLHGTRVCWRVASSIACFSSLSVKGTVKVKQTLCTP